MYLTSFVHRAELLELTERWFCNRLLGSDGLRLTQILICDGFVLGETLHRVTKDLLGLMDRTPSETRRLHVKGDLREIVCSSKWDLTPRMEELFSQYRSNPEYFYAEAPVDATVFLDEEERLLALYRVKRPQRIAEKANRYIATDILKMVRHQAQEMAEERARNLGIPLKYLLTPKEEMTNEFARAEEVIARAFREGTARFDRKAVTINDVGGIKVLGGKEELARLEKAIFKHPAYRIKEKEEYRGNYRARGYIIDVPWDREAVCRAFMEKEAWKKYRDRGLPERELQKGLEPLLEGAEPGICLELTLSTFADFVESELGESIHEERIARQRGLMMYRGYIPRNVEFLIEYLFAVALSPSVTLTSLPVKLWGRYLPDTIGYHIRRLYYLPEHDALY